MIAKNRRLTAIVSTVGFLLLIPLVAMQFNTGVDWDETDFIVAGVLLLGTGLLIELVLRKVKKTSYRIIVCGAILLVLFLIWAELAVGVFGTPFAGS
jgi:hypothetical protein